MKIILFVLNDPTKLLDLLNAWKEAGVNGATVLSSTGMGRIHPCTVNILIGLLSPRQIEPLIWSKYR